MDQEITRLLSEWPYEPYQLNVRECEAMDGRRLIQVRVELGILQFETSGRPDGLQQRGETTLLAALQVACEQHEAIKGGPVFHLEEGDAAALRDEAALFHQRYVGLLSLEDFEGVVADTSHNLAIFDFCQNHGSTEQDREVLEQFRARVMATRARAIAAGHLRDGQAKAAMTAIDEAIVELRTLAGTLETEPPEITLLEGMRDVLIPKLPSSQRHELEQRLNAALSAENYELAALLRDELRMMK